jgi:hypothetical protein
MFPLWRRLEGMDAGAAAAAVGGGAESGKGEGAWGVARLMVLAMVTGVEQAMKHSNMPRAAVGRSIKQAVGLGDSSDSVGASHLFQHA